MKLPKFMRSSHARASTMNIQAQAPMPDRHGLAIMAIMKNEEHNVADWLRFHMLAGVRHIYLYDDGSTDRTVQIAKATAAGKVTILPWKLTVRIDRPDMALSRQVLAYCHAIDNFGPAYRWMGFIDIDEYLVPLKHLTLNEALAGLENHTNISIPWTMFGPNGHDQRPEIPAVFAFTSRAKERTGPVLNFKCIVDPTDITQVRVHRFRTKQMGRSSSNDVGKVSHYKRRSNPSFVSSEIIQLNHYYTRSKQELDDKLAKGAVSGAALSQRNDKVMEKLRIIERTATEDLSALEFLAKHGITTPDAFTNVS